MNSPPPEDKPSFVEDFFPGYFALVMATGIVSLAMHFEGFPGLPEVLLWLNVIFYVVLWGITVLRIAWFRSALIAVIDVPANTIRAVQNDQRTLTKRVGDRIVLSTGAAWRQDKAQWIYALSKDDALFSYALYLEFRKIMAVRPATHRSDVEAMIQDVYGLFETIPDERWHALWFRFSDFIQERKAEIEALPQARKKTKLGKGQLYHG